MPNDFSIIKDGWIRDDSKFWNAKLENKQNWNRKNVNTKNLNWQFVPFADVVKKSNLKKLIFLLAVKLGIFAQILTNKYIFIINLKHKQCFVS